MVTEKEIETKDWEADYLADRPVGNSIYFSDTVPEGEVIFKASLKFLSEGEKIVNNFGKDCIKFEIETGGKKLLWEVGANQFDLLRKIASNKPLVGKVATLERTGTGTKDTRRKIEFTK